MDQTNSMHQNQIHLKIESISGPLFSSGGTRSVSKKKNGGQILNAIEKLFRLYELSCAFMWLVLVVVLVVLCVCACVCRMKMLGGTQEFTMIRGNVFIVQIKANLVWSCKQFAWNL